MFPDSLVCGDRRLSPWVAGNRCRLVGRRGTRASKHQAATASALGTSSPSSLRQRLLFILQAKWPTRCPSARHVPRTSPSRRTSRIRSFTSIIEFGQCSDIISLNIFPLRCFTFCSSDLVLSVDLFLDSVTLPSVLSDPLSSLSLEQGQPQRQGTWAPLDGHRISISKAGGDSGWD